MTRRPSSTRHASPSDEPSFTSDVPTATFGALGRRPSEPTLPGFPGSGKIARSSLPPPGAGVGTSGTPSSAFAGRRPSLSSADNNNDPWSDHVARVAEAPQDGSVRGLYFSEILRLVPALRSAQRRRYVAFSKYPLREYMQLLIDAGRTAHPARSPDEALKMLGLTTYRTFASSIAGTSLLSSVAIDGERVVPLIPKIYELTIEPCRVRIVSAASGDLVAELRDLWTFPESYHVGIWLGAMDALDVEGEIDVIRHHRSSVDFHVHWKRK